MDEGLCAMKNWRKLVAMACVALLSLLVVFGLLKWRGHIRREKERARQIFDNLPKGFRLPPKDISAWLAECGANEPDPSTPEGKTRLRDEARRLPEAKREFQNLLNTRPVALTNETEGAAQDYLDRMARLLDGFSRENCGRMMGIIDPCWGGGNPGVQIKSIRDERLCAQFIERYYLVHCRLADWFWTRCGSEYNAAEMDRAIFAWLSWMRGDCERKGWTAAVEAIERCLEIHRRDRCDSEKSNYCRAHRWGEKLYDTVYADIIREDPRWVKGTESWHGVFLKSARYYLKREPKWSPDYNVRRELGR